MELVVDANVLFAALISSQGKTRELLFREALIFYAPDFIFEEIEKYSDTIIKKSGLTKEGLDLVLTILSSRIKIVSYDEFSKYIPKAEKICPDPNDVEYFAVALMKEISVWSNDQLLKEQSEIKVYSTTDLLKRFD